MMDSTRLNAEGAAQIKAHIVELDAINTREELLSRCAKEHDNLLFAMYISTDQKDADNNIVCVSQSGLSLGENIADHGGLNGRLRRLRHPADRLPLRQTRGQGPHLVIFPSEYSFYLLSPLIKFTTTFTIVSISSVLLSAIIKVNATKALSAIRLCPSGA